MEPEATDKAEPALAERERRDVLQHPLRRRMQAELAKGLMSPKDLARILKAPLAAVIYHYAVLEEADGVAVAGENGQTRPSTAR